MSFDQRELELALKASSISIMGLVSDPERLILAAVTVSNRPNPDGRVFSADELGAHRANKPTSRVIDIDDVGVLTEEREGFVHVLADPAVASLTLSDALLLALLRRDSTG